MLIYIMIGLTIAGIGALMLAAFEPMIRERREWVRTLPAVGSWNYKGKRRRTVDTEDEDDQMVRMGW